jgi:hypothetical protein
MRKSTTSTTMEPEESDPHSFLTLKRIGSPINSSSS